MIDSEKGCFELKNVKGYFSETKNRLQEKRERSARQKQDIERWIHAGEIEQLKTSLEAYYEDFPQDFELYSYRMAMYLLLGDVEQAREEGHQALNINENNFDILYNLGYICELQEEYQSAFEYYIRAGEIAKEEQEWDLLTQSVERVFSVSEEIDQRIMGRAPCKQFPKMTEEKFYMGEGLFVDAKTGRGYFSGYADNIGKIYSINHSYMVKTETVKGKKYTNKFRFRAKEDCLLPILFTDVKGGSISDQHHSFDTARLSANKFEYFRLNKEDAVEVYHTEPFIVGDPLAVQQQSKNRVKNVLFLFIDGLSQYFLDQYGLQTMMPNTHDFFGKGMIFKNCYSNGEWTLPGVASVFSSKFPSEHRIYHPELKHELGRKGRSEYKILPDYFKEKNYMTFQVCGDWRKTPSYGYAKSFDRTLYQPAAFELKVKDIIFDFLENERTFGRRDCFSWITFFELHRVTEVYEPEISVQAHRRLENLWRKNDSKKSVHQEYDPEKIAEYIQEVRRLDHYLKIIYDHMETNYEEEEMLVVLCSDHGQSFFDDSDFLMRESRFKVPLMMRGAVDVQICEELTENIDILPTVLKACGISYEESTMNGQSMLSLEERKNKEYIYSESIYPGQTYKAAIRKGDIEFYIESEGLVQDDGRFELGNFEIKLLEKNTKNLITEMREEELDYFMKIFMDHTKYMLRY